MKAKHEDRKATVSLEEICRELAKIAFVDVKELLGELTSDLAGDLTDEESVFSFKKLLDSKSDKTAAIKKLEMNSKGTLKLEFYDKLEALQELTKLLNELNSVTSEDKKKQKVREYIDNTKLELERLEANETEQNLNAVSA